MMKKVDLLKLAVVERHHHTKKYRYWTCPKDFGFKGGVAMTIAHDSHNLIIVGSSDIDMQIAAHKIQEIQGGIVLVKRQISEFFGIEVGGLDS